MTNIFQLLWVQYAQKAQTYVFPEHAPTREGYRGLVRNDFEQCIGCGTCETICPSNAIKLMQYDDSFQWNYDPGACTFCARCVDYCPVNSLKMDPLSPPNYESRETLTQCLVKPYPTCPVCGGPALPVNSLIRERVFPETSVSIETWMPMCQDCRQKQFHIELLNH